MGQPLSPLQGIVIFLLSPLGGLKIKSHQVPDVAFDKTW